MDPGTMRAFRAELEKIALMNEGEPGFWSAAKAPFEETAKLVRPGTAPKAWKDLWRGSANEHPLNRGFLHEELHGTVDPKTGVREGGAIAGLKGKGTYIDDIAHGKGVRSGLRRGGWLANMAKYEGPSTWRKGVNAVTRHLPGQRTLLLGGTALGVHSDLQKKDPITGRERGAAERGLAATGGVAGSLGASAPGAVRAMTRGGIKGMAGGLLGSAVLGIGGSMGGGYLGRKIDEARGFKPSAPPEQGTG